MPIIDALRNEGVHDLAVTMICEGMMLASGRQKVVVSPADLVAAVQEVAIAHFGTDARAQLDAAGLRSSADVGAAVRLIEQFGAPDSVPDESPADYENLPWFNAPRPEIPARPSGG